MTTLFDEINDCFVQYEKDTIAGAPEDLQALKMSIEDTIKDYFKKITS